MVRITCSASNRHHNMYTQRVNRCDTILACTNAHTAGMNVQCWHAQKVCKPCANVRKHRRITIWIHHASHIDPRKRKERSSTSHAHQRSLDVFSIKRQRQHGKVTERDRTTHTGMTDTHVRTILAKERDGMTDTHTYYVGERKRVG